MAASAAAWLGDEFFQVHFENVACEHCGGKLMCRQTVWLHRPHPKKLSPEFSGALHTFGFWLGFTPFIGRSVFGASQHP